MTLPLPRIAPQGDGALTVSFAPTFSDPAHQAVVRRAAALADAGIPGLIEVVPGVVALTVLYDVRLAWFAEVRDAVLTAFARIEETGPTAPGRTLEIPVRYDGPDLASVADATGLTVAEVIERHQAVAYQVELLGFVPGFGYLGPLDPALVLARRATPRPRVPAGSVAIAGAQTGIYPAEPPGGWHLIGSPRVRLVDPGRSPPALFAVGDTVRFVSE